MIIIPLSETFFKVQPNICSYLLNSVNLILESLQKVSYSLMSNTHQRYIFKYIIKKKVSGISNQTYPCHQELKKTHSSLTPGELLQSPLLTIKKDFLINIAPSRMQMPKPLFLSGTKPPYFFAMETAYTSGPVELYRF